jgi:hypothetical protein
MEIPASVNPVRRGRLQAADILRRRPRSVGCDGLSNDGLIRDINRPADEELSRPLGNRCVMVKYQVRLFLLQANDEI